MAFAKEIINPSGVPVSYWKIVSFRFNRESGIVSWEIAGYLSQDTARKNMAQAGGSFSFRAKPSDIRALGESPDMLDGNVLVDRLLAMLYAETKRTIAASEGTPNPHALIGATDV